MTKFRLNYYTTAFCQASYEAKSEIQHNPNQERPSSMSKIFHRSLFEKALEDGQKDFSKCTISGVDLSGLTLDGLDFTGAMLAETQFLNCIIKHCKFNGACLFHANFSGADMVDSDFINANMSEAIFSSLKQARDLNFSGGSFTSAKLSESTFSFCTLDRCNLSNSRREGFKQDNTRSSKGAIW